MFTWTTRFTFPPTAHWLDACAAAKLPAANHIDVLSSKDNSQNTLFLLCHSADGFNTSCVLFPIGGFTRALSSLVSFCDELGHGVRVMGAMRQKRIDSGQGPKE